jgi:hypothetical protein
MKPWEKMAAEMKKARSKQPRITSEEAARQRQAMKSPVHSAKPAPKLKQAA